MRRLRLALLLGGLLAPAAQAQSGALPPLLLDHLHLVLDSATYHDISVSPFLASQFAGHELRRADASPSSWDAVTFYGRHTYLEFLAPRAGANILTGDAGIALSSERSGGILALARQFAAQRLSFDTVTRMSSGPATPFPMFMRWAPAGAAAPSPRSTLWVMEYSAAMAHQLSALDSLGDDDRSRGRFLAGRLAPDQLLAELTAATLALPVQDIAKIGQALEHAGVRVIGEGEGAVIQLPGFTLRLLPAWDRPGVRKLEFSLNREALANPTYRFGPSSRLRFGPGRVAVWEF